MVLRGACRFGLVLARRRAGRVLLLAGLVFAVLPAGSALADITIGQVGGEGLCGDGPLADTNYVVPPGGGTITSFSYRSDSNNKGEVLDFLVLAPAEGKSRYRVMGTTGLVTLQGTGLETFQVTPPGIPVQGGWILGWWVPSPPGFPGKLFNCGRKVASGGGFRSGDFATKPTQGDIISFPGTSVTTDLNESANLATRVGGPPPPTSKQQCKHGGWKNFGNMFKNQGQCMRLVEQHHHKNHPSGLPVRVWES